MVEDPVRSHTGFSVLDTDRCTTESIAYATAILNAWVTELWPIWTEQGAIRKRLDLTVQEIQKDVIKQWRLLDGENKLSFETICVPAVKKALEAEKDMWDVRAIVLSATPRPQARDEHASERPKQENYDENWSLTGLPLASERGAGNVHEAAYARDNPAPLLRPVKSARLIAIATLRDDAREAIQKTAPKAPQEAEQCVRPAHSKYAKEIFDRSAEAKLQANSGGRQRAYGRWLRSKCLKAVVEDVCGVYGQFTMTVRHVADFIGDRYPCETYRALWGILARDLDPGSFRDQLRARLSAELEVRSLYWEGQMDRPNAKVRKVKAGAEAPDAMDSSSTSAQDRCQPNQPVSAANKLAAPATPAPGATAENPKDLPGIVREWEMFKSTSGIDASLYERVPESFLRDVMARRHATTPVEVTQDQIRAAAVELCRHYRSFQMVSLQPEHAPGTREQPEQYLPTLDAAFWKEREEEFRKHDSADNAALMALWFSLGDHWRFRTGSGTGTPPAEAVRVFRSLSREAAKGLYVGNTKSDPWVDWLDSIRTARDTSNDQLLYAKVALGEAVTGERELERQVQAGEIIPKDGFVEFLLLEESSELKTWLNTHGIVGDLASVEKRMYWDTSVVTIERVFKTSADWCLELRSRSPKTEKSRRAQIEENTLPEIQEYSAAGSGRHGVVQAFLTRCNKQGLEGFKVQKKHIWLAAGHKHARQFQYWQSGSDQATREDVRNFGRIVSMAPTDFFALLSRKGIRPTSS